MYLIEAFLVLRESEDDETPQRAFSASEEAHREPAESVVYFRSGILCRSLYQLRRIKSNNLFDRTGNRNFKALEKGQRKNEQEPVKHHLLLVAVIIPSV